MKAVQPCETQTDQTPKNKGRAFLQRPPLSHLTIALAIHLHHGSVVGDRNTPLNVDSTPVFAPVWQYVAFDPIHAKADYMSKVTLCGRCWFQRPQDFRAERGRVATTGNGAFVNSGPLFSCYIILVQMIVAVRMKMLVNLTMLMRMHMFGRRGNDFAR